MDFEALKRHLSAWYEHAEHRDFEVFYQQFLGPRAARRAVRARLTDDEVATFCQEAAKAFADRDRRVGEAAEGIGYWSHHIGFLLMRFLRTRKRWRDRHVLLGPTAGHGQPQLEPGETPSNPSRVEALDARRAVAIVREAYDDLPDREQQAVVAFTWPAFEALADGGALTRMATASARDEATVREILEASTAFKGSTSVRALFSDAELASNRSACLDAYRKRRDRAFARLRAALPDKEALL